MLSVSGSTTVAFTVVLPTSRPMAMREDMRSSMD
jgi:hypothetical protein